MKYGVFIELEIDMGIPEDQEKMVAFAFRRNIAAVGGDNGIRSIVGTGALHLRDILAYYSNSAESSLVQ